MLIRNATAYLGGRFVRSVEVRIHNGCVQELGSGLENGLYEDVVDLENDYLLPGFVDVHLHAFRGSDAMQGEQAVRRMSRELYRMGVAAFLPTTMSAPEEETRLAVEGIRRVMHRGERLGARVLGAHMEAPFLQPLRAGAQRKEHLALPDWNVFERFSGGAEGVRMITLAPELEGSEAFIRAAVGQNMVVSIGHTLATAEQTHAAADWGASHVTHLFNAQPPLHHRAPGVSGAALTDDRLYAEIICDGVHLHPDMVRLVVRAKGADKTVVVTDAMEAAGMGDGSYQLGGQQVTVKAGEARLTDGTLAGSVLTMREALSKLIHRFGIAPEDAVRMCTQTPAESVGECQAGHLVSGSPAPLTRWSKDWKMIGILD